MAKQSFQLHYAYCIKNITKCPYCLEPIATKELQSHIDEMKGTDEQVKQLALDGKFEELKKRLLHGASVSDYRDKDNWNNSLIHIAAKSNNKELISFLNQNSVNLDIQNQNGETALHLVCGQQSNSEIAKFLVLSGASTSIKNALGDTPITLAKRCGNHELALLLNTSENQSALAKMNNASSKQTPSAGVFGGLGRMQADDSLDPGLELRASITDNIIPTSPDRGSKGEFVIRTTKAPLSKQQDR